MAAVKAVALHLVQNGGMGPYCLLALKGISDQYFKQLQLIEQFR